MFLLFWGVIFFFVRNVQNLTTIVVRLKTRRQLRRRIIRIKQRVCRIRVRTGWPRAFIVLSRFCFFPIRYVCKRVITYGFWTVGVFPFYHTPQQQVLSAYKKIFFFIFTTFRIYLQTVETFEYRFEYDRVILETTQR